MICSWNGLNLEGGVGDIMLWRGFLDTCSNLSCSVKLWGQRKRLRSDRALWWSWAQITSCFSLLTRASAVAAKRGERFDLMYIWIEIDSRGFVSFVQCFANVIGQWVNNRKKHLGTTWYCGYSPLLQGHVQTALQKKIFFLHI